jgi:hypothetical protein
VEVILEYMRLMKESGEEVHPEDIGSEPEDHPRKKKRTSRKRKQEDNAGKEEPKEAKKAKAVRIQEPAPELGSKRRHDESKGKQEEQLPFVAEVLDDSENTEDEVPLTRRLRRKQTTSEAPEERSDKGISQSSDSIPTVAQPLPSSHHQSDDEIDDSQLVSVLLPESTQVLPAIPQTASVEQLISIKDTVSGLRQQKLAEIQELAQQYQDLQPPHQPFHPESDSLTILEQHYNGEFEQALHTHTSYHDPFLFIPNLPSDQAQPSTSLTIASSASSIPPPTLAHSDELTSDTEPRFTMILNPQPPISLKPQK